MSSGQGIDKRQARRSFERAAEAYDQVAVLQREVGSRILERLDYVRIDPRLILDVGAGTGHTTGLLARRYPRGRVLALDFALSMLRRARRQGPWLRRPRCICGDAELLPIRDASVDLLFSNLTLQWCNDLEGTFRELGRVLRPGGLLMFSTFGPDTLRELRESWEAVDGDPHVSRFPDMHDVGDALLRCRIAEPVVDAERITLTYEGVDGLMRDLKLLGAHNASPERRRGLTGKGRLEAMRRAYERFRVDDRLPATYEVVYGHAWAPQARSVAKGVAISVDQIRRSPMVR